MQHLRSTTLTKPLMIASLALLLSGCIVVKDSPAPGCVETIGFPISGGCFGKTVILDLTIEPEHECLDITANNCNGGVLEVHNTCQETLLLGGVEISPSDYVGLDVVEGEDRGYSLREESSNFSDFIPEENKSIVITGVLGSQEIKVTFTKTAQLCE
jgi:hypothetical protein